MVHLFLLPTSCFPFFQQPELLRGIPEFEIDHYWLLCVPRGKSDSRFCCTHTTSQGSNITQRTAIQSATPLAKNLPNNSVPSHPPHKAASAPILSIVGHFFLPQDAGQNFAETDSRPISRPNRSQKKERASITNLVS